MGRPRPLLRAGIGDPGGADGGRRGGSVRDRARTPCGDRRGGTRPGARRAHGGSQRIRARGGARQRAGARLTIMWGIIPAAGIGSRIQPLAFSKELLPVGSRIDGATERPRAVSEYLIERMVRGGASKICFVISPGKSDILEYYGGSAFSAEIFYAVQPRPAGLCDAIFRAAPLIDATEEVIVGLPDTIWFPEDALCRLDEPMLSFLLFPVERPEFFDAVVTDETGAVLEI